jgi:hypothetical protein
VKEHALPRAAWLQLRHVRAAWQELGARLSEHQVGASNPKRPQRPLTPPAAASVHLTPRRRAWMEGEGSSDGRMARGMTQAHILLRTSYNLTLTEVTSATAARLAWHVSWEQAIVDGLAAPLTDDGMGRWRSPNGDTREVNVSMLEEEEAEGADDESLGEREEEDDSDDDPTVEEEHGDDTTMTTKAVGRQFTLVRLTYSADPGERFYGASGCCS